MNILNLSAQQLRKAADLQEKIASLQRQLAELDGGEIPVPFIKAKRGRPPGKGRGMSAAGRARIAAAQRARWAKARGEQGESPKLKKRTRKMSAEGRARIIAAQKARWAKVKAQKNG